MSTETESVDLVDDATVKNVARAALCAALTGAFAYVSFPYPLSPAPVTLQVLGVFLAGLLLGPVWGGAAMVLYLTAGAVGAPVFAGGEAGIGSLVGPTAGYLWSYPLAAGVVGALVHGRSVGPLGAVGVPRLIGAMAVGVCVIYAVGVAGLMAVLGLSLPNAVLTGAVVFLPAEALKMAAAVGIVRSDRLTAA
ncbi:BioY family protein [Halalkalicoccus paucihalophilus]|uniref:BioY family protein n=1 Tax=Halalkalicoccus paucihalophilus TaxID=1008153 RepID=A0A151AHI8_9EURY|nr:biotin transporter BioY [Halalkalicoccus paucihalophilus]KYH27073.1 BioY family protein [Halalkalicoccus paucihalophilus]